MFSTNRNVLGRNSIIGFCAAAVVGLGLNGAANAQHPNFPDGGNATKGNPNINLPVGDWMSIILNDPATVIEWQNFSIASGNTVQFSGAMNDAVLNYVLVGGDPSTIFGHILAPQISVYLVNPAGIVFGANSTVNAGQFIAAASVLNNAADFFQSSPHFDGVQGMVVNHGTINAHGTLLAEAAVHLIGTQVRNHGSINVTPGGFITLTAYNNGSVTLQPFGDRYHVTVAGGNDVGAPNTGVMNTGSLNAPSGTIQLGAGDMYSLAIQLEDSGSFGMAARDIHFGSSDHPDWNTEGDLELASTISITAENANFWGTVDSEANQEHDLDLSGNANFHDAVGSGANQKLGNLTVGGDAMAASTIHVGDTVDIAGAATFGGNVTAESGSILVGEGVTITNSLTLDAGDEIDLGHTGTFNVVGQSGNENLVLTSQNGATVSGELRNLTNVTVNFGDLTAGNINLFGSLTSNDANVSSGASILATSMSIDGNLTAVDDIIATNGNIAVDGHIQSSTAFATGDIQAGWATISGTTIAGGSVIMDNAAEESSFGGNVTADTGSIDIAGNAIFGANVTAGQNVTFGGNSTFVGAGNQTVSALGGSINATTGEMRSNVGGDLILLAQSEVNLNDVIVEAGGSLDITGLLTSANLTADQDITVNSDGGIGVQNVTGNMIAGGSISVLDNFFVGGNVEAGEDITFGANGEIQGNVMAGNGLPLAGVGNMIFGDGQIFGGDVIAGNNLTFLGTATFNGANAQIARAVKGTLHAHGLVSSINNGDLTLRAGTLVQLDDGASVASGGDSLFIHGSLQSGGNLFADQDVTVFHDSIINGNVTALNGMASFGSLSPFSNTEIDGNVFADGHVWFFNEASVTGNVTASDLGLSDVIFFRTSNVGGDVFAGRNAAFIGHATLGGNVLADQNVGFGIDGATFIGADQVVIADNGGIEALGHLLKNTPGDLVLDGNAGVLLGDGAAVQTGNLFILGSLTSFNDLTAGQSVIIVNDSFVDGNVQAGLDALFLDNAVVTGNVTADIRDVVFLGTSDVGGNVHAGRHATFVGHATLGGNVFAFNNIGFGVDGATFVGGDQTVIAQTGELFSGGELRKTMDGDWLLRGRDVVLIDRVIHDATGDLDVEGDVSILFGDDVDVRGGSLMVHHAFTALGDLLASADITLLGAGEFAGIGVDQTVAAGGTLHAHSTLTSTEAGNLTLSGATHIQLDDTVDVQDGSLFVKHDFTALADLLASADIELMGAGTFAGVGVDQTVGAGGTLHAHSTLTSTAPGNLTLRGLAAVMLDDTVDVQDGSLTIENAFTALAHLLASEDINLHGAGTFAGAGVNQIVDAGGTLHAHSTLTSTAPGNLTLRGGTHIQLDNTVDVQGGSLDIENAFTALANLLASQNITLHDAGTFAGSNQSVLAQNGTLTAMGELTKPTNGSLTLGGGSGILLEDAVHVLGLGGNLFVLNNVMINGGLIRTTGNQEYQGTVLLGDHTDLFAGNTVTFHDTVNSNALGTWSLAVRKFADGFGNEFGGNVVIMGDLGGAANGLLQEFIAEGDAEVGANIMVANGIRFDGSVDLFGDSTMLAGGADGVVFGSTVDGGHVLTVDATTGSISFHDQVGGSTPLAGLILNARNPDGPIILFDTDLVHVIGDILLNVGNAIPTDHTLAQIAGTGDLTFIAQGGRFEMGQNQKMSVLGDLLIQSGVAVLGDLNTLGNMSVDADEIIILLRPGVDGFDMGVDFVAGGQIFFRVVPTTVGDGLPPQFSNPDGNADLAGTLQGFLIRAFGEAILPSDLLAGGVYFDLAARGPATTDLSTALAAETPDGDTDETDTEAALPSEAIQALIDRGFLVRVLDGSELTGTTQGRGIYLDGRNVVGDVMPAMAAETVALTGGQPMDISLVRGLPEDRPWNEIAEMLQTRPVVVMQRVSRGVLDSVIDSIDRLYMTEDPETGQPLPGPLDINLAVEITWEQFIADRPDAHPLEYGQFLRQFMAESPDDEDRAAAALTLEFMAMMREFQNRLHAFGMSRGEANRMMRLMLRRDFLPQDVPADSFLQALQGAPGEPLASNN